MLTTFDQDEDVFDALRAGASGYVLKNTPSAQLVQAIKIVAAGQAYLQAPDRTGAALKARDLGLG